MVEEFPGETEYRNYDPDNIQSAEDVVDYFSLLAMENRQRDNIREAAVYDDAARFIEQNFLESGFDL